MLCPSDTPEGEACGLVKNLALMTHITVDTEEESIIQTAFDLGVEDISLFTGDEIHAVENPPHLVLVNGTIIGIHRNAPALVKHFRKLRRELRINEFVNISTNEHHRTISVASDGGRVCRPLIIVDRNGRPRVTQKHMDELKAGKRVFHDFLKDGLLEFLDVNEENDSYMAVYEKDIEPGQTTHLEIEPVWRER